ncbi:MAG: chorismate lyase [Candidatus Thioglobus sp.]|nr:chorismate lyase [Candidatus Thioglobus sp.]
MINTQNLVWADLQSVKNVPAKALNWLADEQSLTAKLRHKFADFGLNVISQTQTIPNKNEAKILDFSGQVLVREVALLGGGRAVVFARSVIPITTDTKDLLEIGTQPLGEILFNNTNIKRGKMQIAQAQNAWGRRRVFTIGETQLLVAEFFLEDLYE